MKYKSSIGAHNTFTEYAQQPNIVKIQKCRFVISIFLLSFCVGEIVGLLLIGCVVGKENGVWVGEIKDGAFDGRDVKGWVDGWEEKGQIVGPFVEGQLEGIAEGLLVCGLNVGKFDGDEEGTRRTRVGWWDGNVLEDNVVGELEGPQKLNSSVCNFLHCFMEQHPTQSFEKI